MLFIELTEADVETARALRWPIFARWGVPAVWLADLPDGVVLVAQESAGDGYARVTAPRRGTHLFLEGLPHLTLGVDELLGPSAAPG